MSTNPAISTTKLILMHASLAYLTDEIRTIDDIIHYPSSTGKPCLPNEILLMIRGWLFPSMTAQFMRQSVSALEAYEYSLCEMLCSDCLAYNVDIYGPDIWNWEQFSCACTPAGNEDPHGHRRARINGTYKQERHDCEQTINWKTIPDSILLDEKHFADPEDWLESYLSKEAGRMISRIGRRGRQHLLPGFSEYCRRSPSVNIWEVVGFVLRELDCEALVGADRGHFHAERDIVQVIPLKHHTSPEMDCLSIESEPSITQEDLDWRAQAALHLAGRDMGLSLKYPETAGFEATGTRRPFVNPKFTRRLCWPTVSHSKYPGSSKDMMDALGMLRTLTSLAGACLTLPITCATLVLTILCFYSKRPLRIF
ncbi:hypothetical protein JR316_0000398 [Psilocybe cubensis]|uniref:Uncharacterized protein n=2 Tax=Psilocybe cubensis TaxID=181762 RepID=A0A8H7Y6S6_PSICU|nr:hypothetical protein JR316_0000398 [Psilocybe cubensis]KAH9486334.1 hypothetical protein JR316_0000398 [Psilocybe cubensis]